MATLIGVSMLQTSNKNFEVIGEPVVREQPSSAAETLQTCLSFGRRQFVVILFLLLLTLSLGLIYIATARPSFTAQAQLLIDARRVQVFQQQPLLGDMPIDAAQVESQAELLKSENVAAAVIKSLHLTEDPEFVGSGAGFLGALISEVGSVFSPAGSDKSASDFETFRSAVATFQRRLQIKRVGLSYVIQISFTAYDPERAAQIANAVADAYITDQLEAKYQATRRASAWLQDRIKELRDQVSVAERAVVDFKTQNNIVSTGGTGTDKRLLGEQQVAELTSQLVIARAASAEAKARLDRINSLLQTDSPAFSATVADVLKSEIVSKLRTQYLEYAAREADWSARYGRDHLAVVNIRNQMRELRNSIFEELKRLGETYKSDYAIAKQREVGVQKELAQAVEQSQATDVKSVTLRELQSTAQTYKTIYDNFLQRYMEAVQQQSFPITEARVISSASRPLEKSHPRTFLTLAFACFGGLLLGIGIGLFRDLSDRVFRTADQVESQLQADCLALVPLILDGENKSDPKLSAGPGKARISALSKRSLAVISRLAEAVRSFALVSDLHGTVKTTKRKVASFTAPLTEQTAGPSGDPRPSSKPAGLRTITRDDNICWSAVNAPFSRFAEAMRSIKLAADLRGSTHSNKVIGLTSSVPNEGKSTVGAALAQLMSQGNARTILVDSDLRNPSTTRMIAPQAKAGLMEVIAGKASLDEVIWTEPATKLAFLPAVVRSRLAHSNEILSSPAVKRLFEQLRERYDYVVVDLPPLAPIVDVRAMTHLADSFIFVVEWGRTKIDVVEHALKGAPGVYGNLLGVVLNKVDMNVFGRYANYQEGYYFDKHYGRYGYTE